MRSFRARHYSEIDVYRLKLHFQQVRTDQNGLVVVIFVADEIVGAVDAE